MKKIYVFIFAVLAICATANAAETPATGQSEIAAKVEAYLNSITTLTANFTQVDPDGNVAGGKFLLKRPGKFKWEYDNRQPVLIVSDGSQLVYYDKKLKEVSYTDLKDSLAGFLARKTIKLSGDVKLVSAENKNGMYRAKLVQKNKADEGSLTMFFNNKDMMLSVLEIEDANGYITKIMLDNQKLGEKISDKEFVFKNPKYQGNVWDKR